MRAAVNRRSLLRLQSWAKLPITPLMRGSVLFTAVALALIECTAMAHAVSAPARPRGLLEKVIISATPAGAVVRLVATREIAGVLTALESPQRIYIDLENTVPRVAAATAAADGPVRRVRVALHE